jgi:type IV secretory pathway protease TraF
MAFRGTFLTILIALAVAAAGQSPVTATLHVNVTASTPIDSLEISLSDVPVPVQTITAQTIKDTNAIDLPVHHSWTV